MALKFYTIVAKGLKLKVRKFCWLIPTFAEIAWEKLLEGLFGPPPSWVGINTGKIESGILIQICQSQITMLSINWEDTFLAYW